jgi:hypothetical protein
VRQSYDIDDTRFEAERSAIRDEAHHLREKRYDTHSNRDESTEDEDHSTRDTEPVLLRPYETHDTEALFDSNRVPSESLRDLGLGKNLYPDRLNKVNSALGILNEDEIDAAVEHQEEIFRRDDILNRDLSIQFARLVAGNLDCNYNDLMGVKTRMPTINRYDGGASDSKIRSQLNQRFESMNAFSVLLNTGYASEILRFSDKFVAAIENSLQDLNDWSANPRYNRNKPYNSNFNDFAMYAGHKRYDTVPTADEIIKKEHPIRVRFAELVSLNMRIASHSGRVTSLSSTLPTWTLKKDRIIKCILNTLFIKKNRYYN